MAVSANGSSTGDLKNPKITFYTSHMCPYSHKVQIALRELGLPYEEVLIELDEPREPWFLEINPRGYVPVIKYSNGDIKDETIIESAVIAQFLADVHPSHLLPASDSSPKAPLLRARIRHFQDTFDSYMTSFQVQVVMTEGEAQEQKVKEWLQSVEKHIEPLLEDAGPFFGGSKDFTMAEVYTTPMIMRYYAMGSDTVPMSFIDGLKKLPNFSKWAEACMTRATATHAWDAEEVSARNGRKIAEWKAMAGK